MRFLNEYKHEQKYQEIFVKDCSFEVFTKRVPEFANLAVEMKRTLPSGYTYYLVDFIVQNCKVGAKTCRDTRYHFDGDFDSKNEYAIWVKGPNRTVFPVDPPDFYEIPTNRNDQSIFLENKLKNHKSYEVAEQTFVRYSSKDAHKGVVCQKEGKRIFLRLMASDYISPKNIFKEKNNNA